MPTQLLHIVPGNKTHGPAVCDISKAIETVSVRDVVKETMGE